MRVALLSYRSKPHCGGQGIYLRHLSRELVALGHEVTVFSGQPYPELDPGVDLVEVPSLDLYRDWRPAWEHALQSASAIGLFEVRNGGKNYCDNETFEAMFKLSGGFWRLHNGYANTCWCKRRYNYD